LSISAIHVVKPVPAEIKQVDKQYLQWTGTQYVPSAYVTLKQKTKVKLPNGEVPELTKLPQKADGTSDPVKVGSNLSYGPYQTVEPSQMGGETVSIRYEYTNPVIAMDKLQRDIDVSHWGGNLAIEEKYWMTNRAAKLHNQFSRVQWASTNYYNPPTAAIKALTYSLGVGAQDPYFTDEIGNVSTSRFRSNDREAYLELRPRYPVFGGWNYSFTVGWNHDLKEFLRVKPSGEDFILKVPFLEGPKEPVVYDEVEVTVILPEGARYVRNDPNG
jgi:oligosaccharyltransferase complex subunit alpha (ribophorin I)